jgi:hypothetical protein
MAEEERSEGNRFGKVKRAAACTADWRDAGDLHKLLPWLGASTNN